MIAAAPRFFLLLAPADLPYLRGAAFYPSRLCEAKNGSDFFIFFSPYEYP
jgi:hypothetical protein